MLSVNNGPLIHWFLEKKVFKWLKFTWIQWDLQKSMKRNCKIFFGHKNVQWPKRLIVFIPVFQQHQSAPKASSSCTRFFIFLKKIQKSMYTPHTYHTYLLTTCLQKYNFCRKKGCNLTSEMGSLSKKVFDKIYKFMQKPLKSCK